MAVALPGTTLAQGTASWGQVGGWKILVDRSVGDGCFAFQPYEDGTIVRIGVDRNHQAVYLLFGNPQWKSLEVGKRYRMRFVFDRASSYDGELVATEIGSSTPKTTVLKHANLAGSFVNDFAQRNIMEIYYQGSRVANLSLRNTYAAISEVVNCQREMGFTQKSSDPFSSGSGNSRDPFAR
ncbi:MAG: hypothetical protein JSS04_06270 [Proteobacteria bacterium]|nr:hypothetical protein [Pseudomonadota bacterium]